MDAPKTLQLGTRHQNWQCSSKVFVIWVGMDFWSFLPLERNRAHRKHSAKEICYEEGFVY